MLLEGIYLLFKGPVVHAYEVNEPTLSELVYLDRAQLAQGIRLACQVMPEHDLQIVVLAWASKSTWRRPNDLLNAYLAVAGLVGTTAARLTSEIELKKHRQHLEERFKPLILESIPLMLMIA